MIDCKAKKDMKSKERWDERIESSNNIIESLRRSIEFIGRHLGIDGTTIDGLKATSGSADYIAMREGLVNLFIHQYYNDPTLVAQIEITKNRAIFLNAGKSLVSNEALIEGGRSQSRNPIISRGLRLIGFAELSGSGLREIHKTWRNAKRRPPQIKSDNESNSFTLILDWRPLPVEHDSFWLEKLGVKITREEASILSLLNNPFGFDIAEISSAMGMLMGDTEAAINNLLKEGLIEEIKRHYKIKEHLRSMFKNRHLQ